MSQRVKAGLSWPGLSVATSEESAWKPRGLPLASAMRLALVFSVRFSECVSRAVGVGHACGHFRYRT